MSGVSDNKNTGGDSLILDGKQIDVYRDTALRYCGKKFNLSFLSSTYFWLNYLNFQFKGYSNEVGESFRPLVPKKVVNLSYAVAIAYVCGDCFDKTVKTYQVSHLYFIPKAMPIKN